MTDTGPVGGGEYTGTGEPRVVVLRDADVVAEAAATRVVERLAEAVKSRGVAHLALTGGSSAVGLYRQLALGRGRGELDWSRVHLWWGDERFVPLDHPESNAGLALNLLLAAAARTGESGQGEAGTDVRAEQTPGVVVPAAQVHPIPTGDAIEHALDPEWAAEQYSASLRREVPLDAAGNPVLDLVLLGVGPDGHIMSAFPGSHALAVDAPLVLAVPAPEHVSPHIPRVTMAPRVLSSARGVLVMVTGSGKAELLASVLGAQRDPDRWPAQLARRGNAVWLLDAAAAARLTA